MPLLKELHEWATVEMAKGHGELHVNPVVIVEHLVKERIKNEREKTRFAWETDTPDGYRELHEGKDRLMQKIVNKQVAISIAAKLWLGTPDIVLQALSDDRPLTLGEISVLLDSDWLYDLLPGNGTDDFILQKVREALREVTES